MKKVIVSFYIGNKLYNFTHGYIKTTSGLVSEHFQNYDFFKPTTIEHFANKVSGLIKTHHMTLFQAIEIECFGRIYTKTIRRVSYNKKSENMDVIGIKDVEVTSGLISVWKYNGKFYTFNKVCEAIKKMIELDFLGELPEVEYKSTLREKLEDLREELREADPEEKESIIRRMEKLQNEPGRDF